MVRISDGEIPRQWVEVQHLVMAEPVTVTHNGHDEIVILSAKEYDRLKRRDRRVMTLDDFTEEDLRVLRSMEPPPESAAFDHEVKD